MATVNKDFKIKNGLIVEGANGTINGYDILTKDQADQNYIIGLIGGSATSNATANAVVLRDEFANFAANVITADLVGDVTGTVSDISNHDTDDLTEGSTNLYFTNARAEAAVGNLDTDDLTEGTTNLYFTNARAEAAVGNLDTDDLAEGTTNLYFTNARAQDALAGMYDPAGSAANAQAAAESYADGLAVNYDPAGSAANAQSAAESYTDTHSGLTSGIHGVTGNVVGTSDTQTLTNKTIGDNLNFVDGANNENSIEAVGNNLVVTSNAGEIILVPGTGMHSYIGSSSEGNRIATAADVNAATAGLTWKPAVNLLAVSDVNMTGSSNTLVIDGHDALVTADIGYRILLTGQAVDSENGIYVYTESSGTYTLTRATDADAFGELVGAAVFVMEGTTYGATSWVQSNHYLTDFTSQDWVQFSGSGSVTAGTGIIVDGLEVSVDTNVIATVSYVDGQTTDDIGEGSTNLYFTNARAEAAVGNLDTDDLTEGTTNLYFTNARAEAAVGNLDTDDLAEGTTNLYFTNARAQAAVAADITSAIDALDTDAIEEGSTNLYFTNARAEAAVGNLDTDDLTEGTTNLYFTNARAEAAMVTPLTTGTQTNITVTYDAMSGTYDFVAENGVSESDTDDLSEGTSNLYFTNARAVAALEAVVPNFTEVDINDVATQIAATLAVATASQVTAYDFPHATYRSGKFLVKAQTATHTEISEVLVTLDSLNNVAITEYAMIGTNGSLFTVTADVSGTDVRIRVTTTENNTDVTVVGTLVK